MKQAVRTGTFRVNLFFLVTALFWFANYAFVPTMTPYLKSIGVEYAAIGSIAGAYGLAQLLCRVPLGFASDLMRKRKVFILIGLLCAAVNPLLFLLSERAMTIWLVRFMTGVSASTWVIFTVLYASYFEIDKMASRISLLNVANTVGMILGKLSGGVAVGLWGYSSAFVLSAGVGFCALLLGLFVDENVPETGQRPAVGDLIKTAKNKHLLLLSMLAIFNQVVLYATVNTFTPEVAAQLGADAVQLGVLSTVASVPTIFAAMLLGWLFARKIKLRSVLVAAFFVQAAGSLVTAFANGIAAVYLASILIGFGCGACMTSLLSHCTLTIPANSRSTAMGVFQAVYSIGMFLGPVVAGLFVQRMGLAAGMLFVAAIAVFAMLLSAFIKLDAA